MKKVLIVDDQESWTYHHSKVIREIFANQVNTDIAFSAHDGYTKVLENLKTPYDYILTDMQMENDYYPQMAGEWFIEQIKNIHSYYKTRIVIISAVSRIKYIAEKYEVEYVPKSLAITSIEPYKEIFL